MLRHTKQNSFSYKSVLYLLLKQYLDVSFADGGEHGADLGHQGIGVRGEGQGVLELLVEVGHAPRDRAASGSEAERPPQDGTFVWSPISARILDERYHITPICSIIKMLVAGAVQFVSSLNQ